MLLSYTVVAEVAGTLLLKFSDGLRQLWPSVGALVAYLSAVVLLARVLVVLPTSVAYTVWTGAGSALVVILAAVFFAQQLTIPALFGIALVTFGVIVLNRRSSSPQ